MLSKKTFFFLLVIPLLVAVIYLLNYVRHQQKITRIIQQAKQSQTEEEFAALRKELFQTATKRDLGKIMEEIPKQNEGLEKIEQAPDTVLPEQTWENLKNALRAGDIELAVQQFVPENRQEYREMLEKAVKMKDNPILEGKHPLFVIADRLGDIIKKDESFSRWGFYYYEREANGETVKQDVEFLKMEDGKWLIEDL